MQICQPSLISNNANVNFGLIRRTLASGTLLKREAPLARSHRPLARPVKSGQQLALVLLQELRFGAHPAPTQDRRHGAEGSAPPVLSSFEHENGARSLEASPSIDQTTLDCSVLLPEHRVVHLRVGMRKAVVLRDELEVEHNLLHVARHVLRLHAQMRLRPLTLT